MNLFGARNINTFITILRKFSHPTFHSFDNPYAVEATEVGVGGTGQLGRDGDRLATAIDGVSHDVGADIWS